MMALKTVNLSIKKLLSKICIAGALVSCTSENIVNNASIRLVDPINICNLQKDSSFVCDFSQVLSCSYMNIIQDSLLLLYDQPVLNKNSYFYKVYSLDDFSYLGECARQGRGPNEFIQPMISGKLTEQRDNIECYIYDLAQSKSFRYSLNQQMFGIDVCQCISDLPDMTFYSIPYLDSLQFIMNIDKKKFLCNVINERGEIIKTVDLYPDNLDAEKYISQLGNCVLINNKLGVVALMMLSLPQVNYISLETGAVHSSAVNSKYKKWKDIVEIQNPDKLMSIPQYYNDATSSDDYIMGVYLDRSINDMISGKEIKPHIHIFDWQGNFLYDLIVPDHVSNIEYDAESGFLYGLDVSEGQIYRYDLSDKLQVNKRN